MIWLAPLAWLGLAAVAVPIAVHLIGRRRPTLLPFPTLRFLPETRLAVRPRRRIQDPGLLALRVAIVVAAAAALAGPLLLSGHRGGTPRPVTRAIVVDASASMSRPTPDGRSAAVEARARAQRLAAESPQSRVIDAARLEGGLDDAIGWLELQGGRREIVLISDFQAGGLDASDVGRVPAEYGVRIERVPVAPRGRVEAGAVRLDEATLDVTLDLDAAATAVSWTRRAADAPPPIEIDAAGPPPAASWAAIQRAAAAGGIPAGAPARKIIVTTAPPPESPSPPAPWMFDVLAASHRVLNDDDRSRVRFAMPSASTLVTSMDPSTDALTAARLVRALADAAVERTQLPELEPATLADSDTQSWTREPGTTAGARPGTDESDARWLWAVVLILLGVETLVRRRGSPAEPSAASPVHARGGDARVA
jgi:hypothetical protein